LEKYIKENGTLSKKQVADVFGNIIDASSYLIQRGRRFHRDITPANIVVALRGTLKQGPASEQALEGTLIDLANSCPVEEIHRKPVPTSGGRKVTNPFLFEKFTGRMEEYDERSEIYSIGANMYYALTGQHLFDFDHFEGKEKLNVEIDGEVQSLLDAKGRIDEKKFRKTVKSKLAKAKICRAHKEIIRKCLLAPLNERSSIFPWSRAYQSIDQLKEEFEEATEPSLYSKLLKKELWPIIIGGFLATGIYTASTYEPKEISLPTPAIQGELFLPAPADEKPIEFAREDIRMAELESVPAAIYPAVDESRIKMATENRVVACLLKSYHETLRDDSMRVLPINPLTEAQFDFWRAHTSDKIGDQQLHGPREYSWVAKAIEVALSKSVRPDGKVDLEDTLAIARLGEGKVNEARRTSGSFEFEEYIDAKSPAGKYVIPAPERNFLKTWLAYTTRNYFGIDPGRNKTTYEITKNKTLKKLDDALTTLKK
jgi:hypothetical protein